MCECELFFSLFTTFIAIFVCCLHNSESKMWRYSRVWLSLVRRSVDRSVSLRIPRFFLRNELEINVLLPIQNDITHQRWMSGGRHCLHLMRFFLFHFHVKYLVSWRWCWWCCRWQTLPQHSSFERVKVRCSRKKITFLLHNIKIWWQLMCYQKCALLVYWWWDALCACMNFDVKSNSRVYKG